MEFASLHLRRVCFGPDAPEHEHLYVKEVEHRLGLFIVCLQDQPCLALYLFEIERTIHKDSAQDLVHV